VLNVLVKECPAVISPLLKLLSSAVTVWVVLSLFVQVTVVPFVIERLVVEKLMFCMVTVALLVPIFELEPDELEEP
jgi:hypothetical protein